MSTLNFKSVKVDGLDIFCREEGEKNKPTIPIPSWIPFTL
jgi:hypothetical protein